MPKEAIYLLVVSFWKIQRDASESDASHEIFTTSVPFPTMAKGSQLTQLKTALTQARVTSRSKKRKRSVAPEREKERRAAQLDEIQRRLNPFDVKVTKLKHDVVGRKLKGITGKPARSKQAGIEQVRGGYGHGNPVWTDLHSLIIAEEDVVEGV